MSILAAGRGLPRWQAWISDGRQEAAEAGARVAQLRAVMERRDSTAASLSAQRHRFLSLAPRIFTGGSAATVGASLLAWVSGVADLSELRIGALQTTADSVSEQGFLRVTVRGDATGDVQGLTRFLGTLERGPTLVIVKDLAVEQPAPGAGPQEREALRIQFRMDGIGFPRKSKP